MNHPAPFRTILATILAMAVLGVTVACVYPEHDRGRFGDHQAERGHPSEHGHEHEHGHGNEFRPM